MTGLGTDNVTLALQDFSCYNLTIDTSGGGTLTITGTGSNTITNKLEIIGGDSNIIKDIALAATGAVKTFNGSIALDNASLTVGGYYDVAGGTTMDNASILTLGDNPGSTNIALNDAGSSVVFSSPATQTYSGTISGAGSVTKSGSSKLLLTGSIGAAGGVSVTDGTLQIGDGLSNSTITSNVALERDTVLQFQQASHYTYAGAISGQGCLRVTGAALTLTGENTYTGGTTISSDGLFIGNGPSGSIAGDVALSGGGELVFKRSNDITFGGAISGNGTVRQEGAGTLTLTGSNTYSGTTVVSGPLVAGSAAALGTGAVSMGNSGANLVVAPGVALQVNSVTQPFGGTATYTFGAGSSLTATGDIQLPTGNTTLVLNGLATGTHTLFTSTAGLVKEPGSNNIDVGSFALNTTGGIADNLRALDGGGGTVTSGAKSIAVDFTASTLTAKPASLSFGRQMANTTATAQPVAITGNALTADISYTLGGANAAAFAVSPASGWNARTGGTLNVSFTPTEARAHSATLTIAGAGASDVVISLSGTGTPTPQANPAQNSITPPGGMPTVDTAFRITAAGHRQDEPGTVKGETRYVPVAAGAGSTSASFVKSGGAYTAQMTLNMAGNYTLTVTFQQQRWDGSAWQDVAGQTDTKNMTLAVQLAGSIGPGADVALHFIGEYAHLTGVTLTHQNGTVYPFTLAKGSGKTRLSHGDAVTGEAVPGSVKITLYAEWLDTLPAGTYTLKVAFDNGTTQNSNSADFTLTRAGDAAPATTASPQTGDGSHMGLWAVLGTASLGGLAGGLALWMKRRRRQA